MERRYNTTKFERIRRNPTKHFSNKGEGKVLRRIMSQTGLSEEEVRLIPRFNKMLSEAQDKGEKPKPRGIATGYFANEKSFTKVHLVEKGKPVCGCVIRNKEFQWCATSIILEYIECENCKRIGRELLEQRNKIFNRK